jgi:hypothetical protein
VSTVTEVVTAALNLDQSQRAAVALAVLDSLPESGAESDDILAEALRPDAEMEAGTVIPLPLDEFLAAIRRPR